MAAQQPGAVAAPAGPSPWAETLIDNLQKARDALGALPLDNTLPALTLADAITRAQQLQEEKRKKDLAKEKQKQKAHLVSQDKFHGASPGADEDKSAYWMFVEVRVPAVLSA